MDKMPPSDIDAENIVLGSLFVEPTLIHRVKSVLDVKDFSSLRSREIFKAMAELSSANDVIDVITVVEKVYSNGRLTDKDSVVSAVHIVESSTFTAQAITHNLRIVKEKSALRNLVNLGETLNVRAMKEQEEPSHLITDVQKSVGELLSDLDGIKNKNEILCPNFQTLTPYRTYCVLFITILSLGIIFISIIFSIMLPLYIRSNLRLIFINISCVSLVNLCSVTLC